MVVGTETDGYDFDLGQALGLEPKADSSFLFSPQEIPSSVLIAGVDEAGRGPLAGPVAAAAVILPSWPRITGLRDSKVVPPEQREALYCEIMEGAVASSVVVIDQTVIDSINILEATLRAMREAVQALDPKPHLVLVDGNKEPGSGCREKTVIRGDAQSASIMAASILAKVTRDQLMMEAHEQYPMYGFDRHKGYGCREHMEALKKYGPCPLHRRSFEPVKSMEVVIPARR